MARGLRFLRSGAVRPARAIPKLHFVEHRYANDPTNWWVPNARLRRGDAAQRRLRDRRPPGGGGLSSAGARSRRPTAAGAVYPRKEDGARDDRSGDDLERAEQQVALGPRARSRTGAASREMARLAGAGDPRREPARCRACSAACRRSTRSSSDGSTGKGVLDHDGRGRGARLSARLEPLADRRVAGEDRRDPAVTDKPVWVTEVGVSTFGAEEVQAWGLRRTAELLIGRAPRIHWYSLYDLPRDLGGDDAPQGGRGLVLLPPLPHGAAARGRHAEAARCEDFARLRARRWASASGSTSRTTGSTRRSRWMRRLGVRHLRTGLSWADSFRPDALDWFDRQMEALRDFDVTRHLLLHARAPRPRAAPHQPAAGAGGVRRVLRRDGAPLCGGGGGRRSSAHA